MAFSKLWLPEGPHWDLNIRHQRAEDSGQFIADAGWKMVWHTGELDRDRCSLLADIVAGKRAAPHLCFGYDPDTRFPVVIQMIPFNRAARTLQHTFAPETNRARCIQCEICGFAANSGEWSDNYYKGLANMFRMVERRVPIPHTHPRSFREPEKFSPGGFVAARGHVGHVHVPGNDHTDPGTGFKIRKLLDFVTKAKDHGLDLRPVPR